MYELRLRKPRKKRTNSRCTVGHVKWIIHIIQRGFLVDRRYDTFVEILWKISWNMREDAILIFVSSLVSVHCHLFTDAGSDQHCEDDTCITDERPCFIPREKGILTRLDGVKVSKYEGKQKRLLTFLVCLCICYYSSIEHCNFGWVIFVILSKSVTRGKLCNFRDSPNQKASSSPGKAIKWTILLF